MLRQYNNKKIYKNLKIAKVLAIINLTLLAFLLVFDLLDLFLWNKTPSWGNLPTSTRIDWLAILVAVYFTPVTFLEWISQVIRKNSQPETKDNNDVFNIKRTISFTFYSCICCGLLSVFAGGIWKAIYFVCCWLGYAFGSNLLIYIADIFLGITCKLIREEWEADPPRFILEEKAAKEERKREIEREKQELLEQKNNEIYENLIQQCGVRFFIKYYEQIESLPLRDVRILEDYPYEEKEERLQAAREIIDKNLQVLAFENILQSYSAMLDSAEIEKAKAILQYLKNKN